MSFFILVFEGTKYVYIVNDYIFLKNKFDQTNQMY